MHQRTELRHGIGLTQRHFYRLRDAIPEYRDHLDNMLPLSQSGTIPPIRRVKRNLGGSEYDLILYDRIKGFSLNNIPDEFREEVRSNSFAKNLARAFTALSERGYVQKDPNSGNFMYEIATGKVWNVDDELIRKRTQEDVLKNDVLAYVQIMNLTLFGIFYDDSACRILLNPDTNFQQKQQARSTLLQEYQTYGIDPELVKFIFDALDEKTRPENFDRITALK